MTVIADAGPLIALSKVDALAVLFTLHPLVLITPTVYDETISRGHAVGAEDAARLEAEVQAGRIEVRRAGLTELPAPALIGPGEAESILLAIETRADWLLVDDQFARRVAERNFAAVGVATMTQGTLGTIASAVRAGHITRQQGIDIILSLKGRPDIWLSAALCERVIDALRDTPEPNKS